MGLVDWGEVFEAFDSVGLEASFVLVEAAAADASSAAGLGDVSEGLGELETFPRAWASSRTLRRCLRSFFSAAVIFGISFRWRRRLERGGAKKRVDGGAPEVYVQRQYDEQTMT